MTMNPLVVSEENLSLAWAKAFLASMEPGAQQHHPAMVSINHLEGVESPPEEILIRELLDAELKKHKLKSCATVAGTIFPTSMWNSTIEKNAEHLFARYEKAWPGIAKCPANKKGVYFRRLTSYAPKDRVAEPVNQLQFVIDTYLSGNHRNSALQASVFDPTRDHTNNHIRGFPCMQQVSFTALDKYRMAITGFYGMQYQFEKAYGNYLGLYWLGKFMAKQLGLELSQVVCMATVLSRGDENKSSLQALEDALKPIVGKYEKT